MIDNVKAWLYNLMNCAMDAHAPMSMTKTSIFLAKAVRFENLRETRIFHLGLITGARHNFHLGQGPMYVCYQSMYCPFYRPKTTTRPSCSPSRYRSLKSSSSIIVLACLSCLLIGDHVLLVLLFSKMLTNFLTDRAIAPA